MKLLFSLLLFISLIAGQGSSKVPYLKSLIFPGWGNLSVNQNTVGWMHVGSEIGLWLGYFFNETAITNQTNDYELFAKERLHLSKENYTREYYKTVARYNSYAQYLDFKRYEQRELNTLITKEDAWGWETNEERIKLSTMISDVNALEERTKFFIGGFVLNRILSVLTTRKAMQVTAKTGFSRTLGNNLEISMSINF